MARLVKRVNNYGVYELDKRECEENYRDYPTFVAWDWRDTESVGDMYLTENESGTLEEMDEWLKKYA